MVERSIEAEEQSKALGVLLGEVHDQTERKLMKLRLSYIVNKLHINQSNIEAEQIKSVKFFSAAPPSKNTPVAQKIQPATKSISSIAEATPEIRPMIKTSSYTGENHRARSTAAVPSRQVPYLSNRHPSIMNPSECKATVFKKCRELKQKKRVEQQCQC